MFILSNSQAKQILCKVAQTNGIFPTASLIPDDATPDAFLNFLQENENIPLAPILTQTTQGELVIMLKVKQHQFDSARKAKTFGLCIAPVTKAGIFLLSFVANNDPLRQIQLNDSWKTGIFTEDLSTEPIPSQSMVYFPHSFASFLCHPDHEASINKSTLARQIVESKLEELEEFTPKILQFLAQTTLQTIAPFAIALQDPPRDGASTQRALEDLASSFLLEEDTQVPMEINESSHSVIEINNPSNTDDEEPIEKDQEMTLSKEDKRLLLLLNARDKSRDVSCFEQFSSILAEERRENKKDGLMKHFPDHAAETLINARAGPGYTSPTKLSLQVSSMLIKCNSDQMALKQIQADLRKIGGNREFDSHLDKITVNSLFKKGELSTEIPVITFAKAIGINFPIFGPKGAINGLQSIKSEADFAFTISEAASITEIIEATRNLRIFMEWIAGSDLTSYAMIGLDNLIEFLETHKGRIKRIAEQSNNAFKEIQIQCANVWSSWFYNCSFEVPTAPPDFMEILKPISNNRPPATTLSSTYEPEQKKQKPNPTNKPNQGSEIKDNSSNRTPEKKNSQPQLTMTGSDINEKRSNFNSKFGGKGTVAKLNLPKHSNKAICMKFHLLHACKCNEKSSFYHGKLASNFIDQLITKSNSDSLMISKL